MLLDRLKLHGGKIMFFTMNILLVMTGVLFIKQKNTEKISSAITESDVNNYKSAADYALDVQKRIVTDQQNKVNSVVNNPDVIPEQQTVQVTRTIPAVTKTVVVQQQAQTTTKRS